MALQCSGEQRQPESGDPKECHPMAGVIDSFKQVLLRSPGPIPLTEVQFSMTHWQTLTTCMHQGLPVTFTSSTAQLCLPPGIKDSVQQSLILARPALEVWASGLQECPQALQALELLSSRGCCRAFLCPADSPCLKDPTSSHQGLHPALTCRRPEGHCCQALLLSSRASCQHHNFSH